MDYGTLVKNLKETLRVATNEAHGAAFGTESYYLVLNFKVHEAFDKFAGSLGVASCDRGRLRDLLKKHCVYYRLDKETTGLNALFHALPDQFNVRGVWTSKS